MAVEQLWEGKEEGQEEGKEEEELEEEGTLRTSRMPDALFVIIALSNIY